MTRFAALLARPVSACLLAGGSLLAHAQTPSPAATGPAHIAHTIAPGDTLEQLALQYFGATRHWTLLQRSNHVHNPRRLVPGSVLHIPVALLPPTQARVHYVHGHVTHGAAGTPVQHGQALQEGDTVRTAEDAFVSVQLADGTIVRVHGQSDVQWQQLRRRGRTGSLQSRLQLRTGGVETSVPPADKAPKHLEIHTPTATTSVRGTQFDVRLAPDHSTRTTVLEGRVAVHSPQDARVSTLVSGGHGVVVDPRGTVGEPRPLMPAPEADLLPASAHDAQWLALPLPPLAGASAWQVDIARDAHFMEIVRQGRFSTAQTAWPALPDGTYHLRVRAVDSGGLLGHPAQRTLSVKTQPVAPLAQAPASGAVLAQGQGQLRCTLVPGVQRYHLQVAQEGQWAHPVLQAHTQGVCALALDTLPEGHYAWRAASVLERPGAAPDPGPFSAPQTFRLEKSPALAQVQSGDDPTQVSLHWSALPEQRFRLVLTRDASGQDSVRDVMLDAPHWQADDLAAGDYYVHLQVHAPSGLHSAFSPPRKISVAAAVRDGTGAALRSRAGAVQSP